MSNDNDQSKKITFYKKQPVICPVCATPNQIEEMLSGRGRISAGSLTPELRRQYEPTENYGIVRPLLYAVNVCRKCLYAAFPSDFVNLHRITQDKVAKYEKQRVQIIHELYGNIDFSQPRDLISGAAAYTLAISCYAVADPTNGPTIKKGISSLRTAWLLGDLFEETKQEKYKFLQNLFYQKAQAYYQKAIEYEQKSKESLGNVRNLGPDIDKNFGFDGVKYVYCVLNYKFAPAESDLKKRALLYFEVKRTLGRIFGFGEKSREKPGPLLEVAKALYNASSKKVNEIEKQTGQKIT